MEPRPGKAREFEPIAFDGHLGALHRPPADSDRGVAVVLCAPVGREARSAYRSLWLLAERLAGEGVTVLRYDHRATGDSMDLEVETDRWTRWVEGVRAAAAFVRRHAAPETLVLAGLRLGASLAAAAAVEVKPDALALLAPAANGKGWLREQKMAAALMGAPPTPKDAPFAVDGVELSPATLQAMRGFDLQALGPFAGPVFLATPSPAPRLAKSLGEAVTCAPFDGYEALFKDAHVNEPPVDLFVDLSDWVACLPTAAAQRAEAAPLPPAAIQGADWVERPIAFGAGLRGVLCLPAGRRRRKAVVFGNTGGDPRCGVGGFTTRAARTLAREGIASLRMDFAGLGESAAAGFWSGHVYKANRLGDFQAAAAVLREHGCEEVLLAGLCAGAFQALHAAFDDDQFKSVLAINPTRLAWRAGDAMEMTYEDVRAGGRLDLHALANPKAWRRALRGEVDLKAVLLKAWRRAARTSLLRRPAPQTRALRTAVERLAARGGSLRILVGREDAALDELELHFGRNGQWLKRLSSVSVHVAAGLDHGLFFPESQVAAQAELLRFIGETPSPIRRLRAVLRGRLRGDPVRHRLDKLRRRVEPALNGAPGQPAYPG